MSKLILGRCGTYYGDRDGSIKGHEIQVGDVFTDVHGNPRNIITEIEQREDARGVLGLFRCASALSGQDWGITIELDGVYDYRNA